jgi:uncharacterized protein YjbJ (UPF0337 family)
MGELLDKARGKVKQVEGAITGDRRTQGEGVIDEKKGELQEGFERVKKDLRRPRE